MKRDQKPASFNPAVKGRHAGTHQDQYRTAKQARLDDLAEIEQAVADLTDGAPIDNRVLDSLHDLHERASEEFAESYDGVTSRHPVERRWLKPICSIPDCGCTGHEHA